MFELVSELEPCGDQPHAIDTLARGVEDNLAHQVLLGVTGSGKEKPRLVLVYDLGGGTFDVTVVRYTPTHFQVLATDGDVQLGGVDWNDRMLDHELELLATP